MKISILIMICLIIFGAAFIIGWKSENGKELTEQEKTMRALRILIYMIAVLIMAAVIIKLLLWQEILKL